MLVQPRRFLDYTSLIKLTSNLSPTKSNGILQSIGLKTLLKNNLILLEVYFAGGGGENVERQYGTS